jgi:hypothetical protein
MLFPFIRRADVFRPNRIARHGRTCSGHPRLCSDSAFKTWIPATIGERSDAVLRTAMRGHADNRSRSALGVRVMPTTNQTTTRLFSIHPRLKGRRSAERRNHPLAAQHQQALPLIDAGARQRTHTTHPRLRGGKAGGRSPSGASPRRSRTRPNVSTQPRPRFTPASGCGRYPHHDWRLSEAPRAPILLPAGSMPGPPGSGAHILRPQEPHPLRLPKVPSRKASLDRAGCHRM